VLVGLIYDIQLMERN